MRYIVLILLLSSCGANYHLRKASKHIDKAIALGANIKRDTILVHDTTYIPKVEYDTVYEHINLYDTIRFESKRTIVKTVYDTLHKRVYQKVIEKPDTIIKRIEVPCTEVHAEPPFPWWWLLITFIVGLVLGLYLQRR
jgi:hypothetical protein